MRIAETRKYVEVTAHDRRRVLRAFITWQVQRARDGVPWSPGDRITLYRVGRTSTFRVCWQPLTWRNTWRREFWPVESLLDADASGDFLELDSRDVWRAVDFT